MARGQRYRPDRQFPDASIRGARGRGGLIILAICSPPVDSFLLSLIVANIFIFSSLLSSPHSLDPLLLNCVALSHVLNSRAAGSIPPPSLYSLPTTHPPTYRPPFLKSLDLLNCRYGCILVRSAWHSPAGAALTIAHCSLANCGAESLPLDPLPSHHHTAVALRTTARIHQLRRGSWRASSPGSFSTPRYLPQTSYWPLSRCRQGDACHLGSSGSIAR